MDWFRSPPRRTLLNIIGMQDLVDDVLYPDSPRISTAAGEQDGRHWLFRRIFPVRSPNPSYTAKNDERDRGKRSSDDDPTIPLNINDTFNWTGSSSGPSKVHFFTRLVDEVPGFAARHGVNCAALLRPQGPSFSIDSVPENPSRVNAGHETGRGPGWSPSATSQPPRSSSTSFEDDGSANAVSIGADQVPIPRPAFEINRPERPQEVTVPSKHCCASSKSLSPACFSRADSDFETNERISWFLHSAALSFRTSLASAEPNRNESARGRPASTQSLPTFEVKQSDTFCEGEEKHHNTRPGSSSPTIAFKIKAGHEPEKASFTTYCPMAPPTGHATVPLTRDTCDDAPFERDVAANSRRSAFEITRPDSFDEDAYEADLEEIISLYEQEAENEIDEFVEVVTSPDRVTFVDTSMDPPFVIRRIDSALEADDASLPASRLPVWNGSVVEPGVTLGDDLVLGGVRWKQVGRKVSHEDLKGCAG